MKAAFLKYMREPQSLAMVYSHNVLALSEKHVVVRLLSREVRQIGPMMRIAIDLLRCLSLVPLLGKRAPHSLMTC